MSTPVRDAIVEHFSKSDGQYFTAEEISAALKLNQSSAYGAMYTLANRAILAKRKREGSLKMEFTVGKRIGVGQKYAGRKLPFHRRPSPEGEIIPASGGSIGIIVKVDGQAHAITLSEAKAMYLELKVLFG